MTILILTHQHGFEADPVIDALQAMDIPYLRLNQDAEENVSEFTFRQMPGGVDLLFSCDGKSVSLSAISMGWFQQEPPFTGQPSDLEEVVQRSNIVGFLEPAMEMMNIPWLNQPSAVMRAARKLHQLHMAPMYGLQVPQTIVSNSPEAVRGFCSNREAVVKNLNSSWVAQGEGSLLSETKIVDKDILGDDDTIRFCPLIYQEFVERRHDYRVVVLGDECFVTRCDSLQGNRADVRIGQGTGESFYRSSLPQVYIKRLRQMMSAFNLNYCSADFIEGVDGSVYFLEMNTCGAWWWMDRIFNGLILRAFIGFLTKEL
ncbi:MAG: hypothetical protein Q8Q32_00405 [bacterium]|nr:hypothetical protein [bacterium]